MRTIFERSFASGFGARPIHGFRPMMGQGSEFSFDPEVAPSSPGYTTPSSPFSFDPGYAPPSPMPVAPPAPTQRPPGTSDTDWAKILAEGLKAASSGYGLYSQVEISKMKAEADLLRARNPLVASYLPPSEMSATTTTLLVLGGIGLLGTVLVFALK